MRKVSLTLKENNTYSRIKDLITNGGNPKRAALALGCSVRTVQRHIKGYNEQGKDYFSHGNHQNKPATTISQADKDHIIDLYHSDLYAGANFRHFCELLAKHEDVHISESSLRSILGGAGLISPKAHRVTKKKHKNAQKPNEKSMPPPSKQPIETSLCDAPHPRREKSKYIGELIQMDASVFNWFANKNSYLHVAIDDSTGILVGAWFDWQETLEGYYQVTSQILLNYGIPYCFYTDNRTVFNYNSVKKIPDKDYHTQFAYACKNLGIQIKTTSIPQAKGKVLYDGFFYPHLFFRPPYLLGVTGKRCG